MELSTKSFEENGAMPRKYTQDGQNVSPELSWSGLPDGTKELALIVDDPDAPTPDPHVHWVVYGIDGERSSIPEDSAGGGVEGLTTGGRVGYNGPAPPTDGGPHRYRFRLFALDESPGLKPGATKEQLMERMEGHVLGETQLVGTYERQLGDTEE